VPTLHLILTAALSALASVWTTDEIISGAVRVPVGIVIAILVYRLVRIVPWPRPFRIDFAALHLVAAPVAAFLWFAVTEALLTLVPGWTSDIPAWGRLFESVVMGVIFSAFVVGISYASDGAARAARAEAAAASTQLAALRAQLHPHFLFNALHTVVQLIPDEPRRAAEAAEMLADLLRATLEAQHDEVTLGDEWHFVSRYLAIERIRFGDRLAVRADMDIGLLDDCVPAFALQTLVENAVRHGAAPRVEPTEIVVTAAATGPELTLSVRNTGDRVLPEPAKNGTGTGLPRLRERLALLYGDRAKLAYGAREEGGYEAVLVVPRAGRES
jgi:hypothetical protein